MQSIFIRAVERKRRAYLPNEFKRYGKFRRKFTRPKVQREQKTLALLKANQWIQYF